MSWHVLTNGNNWGSRHVMIGPIHLDEKFGTWDPGEETTPMLEKPGPYRCRWADGTEETLIMEMVPYTETVYDMGHSDQFSGHEPYFILPSVHGQRISIPARKLGVEVWREEAD